MALARPSLHTGTRVTALLWQGRRRELRRSVPGQGNRGRRKGRSRGRSRDRSRGRSRGRTRGRSMGRNSFVIDSRYTMSIG